MFTSLVIPDVLLIRPRRYLDSRGWFSETYKMREMIEYGIPQFVQDNESLSAEIGTMRGLHYQREPLAQAKLVRCIAGAIFDVVVDIRRDSPTFGQHVSLTLEAGDGLQVFVPVGFAHGFCTLRPDTLVQYKTSAPYAPEYEGGLAWNDPALQILWPLSPKIISDRDRDFPPLDSAEF